MPAPNPIDAAQEAVDRCLRELAEAQASLKRDRLAHAACDTDDAAAWARARENLKQARRAEAVAADRLEHAKELLSRAKREVAK